MYNLSFWFSKIDWVATAQLASVIVATVAIVFSWQTLQQNIKSRELQVFYQIFKDIQSLEDKFYTEYRNKETEEKKNAKLSTLVEDIFTCLCRDFSKDQITVNIEIPQDLTVWAVPVQIQQVLMNLILNSRDAMLPQGGVLTIKAQDTAESVQIEISDAGCGISPDDLKNIFEPFFTTKADKKSTAETSGCGLGLAFCKKVIDAHDGTIKVESIPSKGTTFQISLPKS